MLTRFDVSSLSPGKWIDATPRLRSALLLTAAQHTLITASCLGLIVQLSRRSGQPGAVASAQPGVAVAAAPPSLSVATCESARSIITLVRTLVLYRQSRCSAAGSDTVAATPQGLSITAGALGGAANSGLAVALERTWPKLLCEGDSAELSLLNVRLRGLDMVRTHARPLSLEHNSNIPPRSPLNSSCD